VIDEFEDETRRGSNAIETEQTKQKSFNEFENVTNKTKTQMIVRRDRKREIR
jgi:hypothetical protein